MHHKYCTANSSKSVPYPLWGNLTLWKVCDIIHFMCGNKFFTNQKQRRRNMVFRTQTTRRSRSLDRPNSSNTILVLDLKTHFWSKKGPKWQLVVTFEPFVLQTLALYIWKWQIIFNVLKFSPDRGLGGLAVPAPQIMICFGWTSICLHNSFYDYCFRWSIAC